MLLEIIQQPGVYIHFLWGPGKLRVAEVVSCKLLVASHKGLRSTSGRRFWRESRRHVALFLSSFLEERSSDENGGIRQRVNSSSSATFQEERLGLGLYLGEEGGVHVKIPKGMLVQFFGFEI